MEGLALPGASAAVIVTVLLLPLGALALLALFVPRSRRAIPCLSVALLGFVTAVVGSRIEVAVARRCRPCRSGRAPRSACSGSGSSAAAAVALDALGRAAVASAFLAAVAATALAVPLLGAVLAGTAEVRPGSGRILPAVVTAEAAFSPSVGTLLIAPEADSEHLDRPRSAARAPPSTTSRRSPRPTPRRAQAEAALATLAGNLASRSGIDARQRLSDLDIGFIVLADRADGDPIHRRVAEALDSNDALSPVGETANGLAVAVSRSSPRSTHRDHRVHRPWRPGCWPRRGSSLA